MDGAARVAEAAALFVRVCGDDLGTDADRRLLGRAGTNVEASRRHQPIELGGLVDPRLVEASQALGVCRAAPHHTDVPDAGRQGADHGRDVELGVVGEDAHGVAATQGVATLREQRCRPRDENLVGHRKSPTGGEHLAGIAHGDPVAEQLGDPGERGAGLRARDAVCILTHDAKFDVPAVIGALATGVGYIGVMGSRATHSKRLARLAEAGVSDPAQLDRLMSPTGLDIGARTPEETAISICAEIIATHTNKQAPSLRDSAGPIH